MPKSARLKIAGILIAVASCFALVASLFLALFARAEYFLPGHLGSVRVITEPFYVELAIIIFELSSFVLGLLSASNTLKGKKFGLSTLGATFLLIGGLLFFTDLVLNTLPPVETLFIGPFLQTYFGLPIFVLASTSMIFLFSRKKEFNNEKVNSSITLKAILILCSIISAFSALFSIVPYLQATSQFNELAASYPFYTMIINTVIFISMSIALAMQIKKKYFPLQISLTALSLMVALSIPFIFIHIFPWGGSFVKGLVTVSSAIILSAIALVLEFQNKSRRSGNMQID